MRILLNTTMAGPEGIFASGSVVDFPRATSAALVAGGFAVALDDPKTDEEPAEEIIADIPKRKPQKRG